LKCADSRAGRFKNELASEMSQKPDVAVTGAGASYLRQDDSHYNSSVSLVDSRIAKSLRARPKTKGTARISMSCGEAPQRTVNLHIGHSGGPPPAIREGLAAGGPARSKLRHKNVQLQQPDFPLQRPAKSYHLKLWSAKSKWTEMGLVRNRCANSGF